jgi:hypothetical protein
MEIYMQMKEINFNGFVIDNGWIKALKSDSGKPNFNAQFVLAIIVQEYSKNDSFNIDIEMIENKIGLTKRQIIDAIKYLKLKSILVNKFKTALEIMNFLKTKFNHKGNNGIGHKICSVCNINTEILHSHHYPIKKCDGGENTVLICANCHGEFHYIENMFELNVCVLKSISSHNRKEVF